MITQKLLQQGLALQFLTYTQKTTDEIMHDLLLDSYTLKLLMGIEDVEAFIYDSIPFASQAKYLIKKLVDARDYADRALANDNIIDDYIDNTDSEGGYIIPLQGKYLADGEYENAFLFSEAFKNLKN